MSKIRKLASQTVIYGFSYFAGRLLNFFLTPYYTRHFHHTADYGMVTLIYAYISFLNVLFTYGMETGYFYYSNKLSDDRNVAGTSFTSLILSSLVLTLPIIVFSSALSEVMGYPGHGRLIIYAAIILLFDTLNVIPFAFLRRHDRSARFAVFKFLNIAVNIFFNFFFLALCPRIYSGESFGSLKPAITWFYSPGHDIEFVFIANILSSLLTLFMLIPDILKIRLKWDGAIWRQMIRYSWPLLILGFAGMINETLDRILLSSRLPGTPEERLAVMGIYSACYKLSIFMTLAVSSFRYAAEPFFFSQMKEADSKQVYAYILKYFTVAAALIFLFVVLYLRIFVDVLIGPAYRSGMAIVPILLLANLFLGIFYYLSQWYKQTEKTLYGAMVAVGGAVITLAINFIFIPQYGYMASAWATFACYFFMAVISFVLGQKYYPVNYETGRIVFYIAFAVGLYFVSYFMEKLLFHAGGAALYLFNTLLLMIYLVVFIAVEKPAFLMNMLTSNNNRGNA